MYTDPDAVRLDGSDTVTDCTSECPKAPHLIRGCARERVVTSQRVTESPRAWGQRVKTIFPPVSPVDICRKPSSAGSNGNSGPICGLMPASGRS